MENIERKQQKKQRKLYTNTNSYTYKNVENKINNESLKCETNETQKSNETQIWTQ